MFKRILLAALLAGVLGGIVATGIQAYRVIPLILQAETYEQAGGQGHTHAAPHEHAPGTVAHSHAHEAEAWAPADGAERYAFTLLSNVIAGIGFALMLTAAAAVAGGIDWRGGLLWGLGGYAVFSLAPALGLPPELPGMAAGELVPRQLWWAGTAFATAAGLGLIVFARPLALRILGGAAIALPHLIGAPHPGEHGGAVPAELAAAFVSATMVANLIFWLVIGGVAGWVFHRTSAD